MRPDGTPQGAITKAAARRGNPARYLKILPGIPQVLQVDPENHASLLRIGATP